MNNEWINDGFKIDVQQNILKQFAQQLAIPVTENQITLDANFGTGSIQYFAFPEQLELYHFKFKTNTPIRINSQNPVDSNWLLLNINLSSVSYIKTVNQQQLNLQKYLPSGMLFYTPKTKVQSISPPNTAFEIGLIRFPKSFLATYLTPDLSSLQNTQNALIYEDLDPQSELLLLDALKPTNNKLKRHSSLLGFLAIFINKLIQRTTEEKYQNLHANDLKGLFLAAAQLRNPTNKSLPTILQLAKLAGMGSTKFKNCFKQVFGNPPIKYHQKIKMEYALQQLKNQQKTVSEISYELGYSHPSKFTSAFKKQFHILPSNI